MNAAPTPPPVQREAVARRLADLRARIAEVAGDRPVTLLAVTKGFGADAVEVALDLGLQAVGENYAQELLGKVAAIGPGRTPRWHFLGRLQRNKVRHLAPHVSVWESLDRARVIEEVAARAPGAAVHVQANLSGEPQKGGAELASVPELVALARGLGLDVRGLMGVAPAGDPELARPGFRALVAMADRLELPERSIGMTADLAVALEEGSTEVRIGTALFGPRPPRPAAP